MDPVEVEEELDDVFLLDVRELSEWEAGHIEEAVHIPMGHLNARVEELPRDQRIVAVCRVGARSQAVVDALVRAGFEAHNLDGGMHAWTQAGLPIVTPDGGPGAVA
jgi:rhodanese-related sulfurtransferase